MQRSNLATHRIIRLAEPTTRTVRFLSGLHVSLEEGKKSSWVTVTRTGSFTDPRYGRFEISRAMLLSMVANFKSETYGQSIFIDLNHKPQDGAAGEIKDLTVEGSRLRALVEWTAHGIEAITKRKMVYLSAEYTENFEDNEAGNKHGPVLLGAALTVRPVIKRLEPVQLSTQYGDGAVLIHPELITQLSQEKTAMNYLTILLASLAAMGIDDPAAKQLGAAFTTALGEDPQEDFATKLLAQFEDAGKQLAEALKKNPAATINLSVAGAEGLGTDEVKKLLADHDTARADAAKKLAESRDAKVKLFSDTVAKAEGLDDAAKKLLCESITGIVTESMDDAAVVALAELQVKQTNDSAVARQLSGMGYTPEGSPRITAGEDNSVKALQEQIDSGIGIKRDKVDGFVAKVLSQFDRSHAMQLANEHKQLAGGTTGMVDTNLPSGFQRTVIREALSDLNILSLVNTMTDFSAAATVNIPYEQRDISAVSNDGIVYEGQGIPGASITQAMDIAYVHAMKLALKVSNEVAYFSRNNRNIDWDAYARNVQSNARVIRELVARRVANEFQRSSDAFGAITRATDTLTGQVNGATSTFKSTYYPIVRQHQVYDLQGNAVGSATNPITVTLGGTALTAYDGTGAQAAGTYYRITSHNLGYIQTVNQLGVAVAPANATALVVSYSEATNVTKFDLDNGATNIEDHLNGLLRSVGGRKAILSGDRFVGTDNMFMLMSPVLNDTVTNARSFVESQARSGAMLTGKGDLATIKGINAFGTNAPSIDLGDERILMGEAGLMGYTIVKPFETGVPFEAVNAQGQPTGQKVAYGEEYNAIKMPAPLRNRLTSVLAYSFTGR